jgi:branched-chain amino acid transport system ATP-binding protein
MNSLLSVKDLYKGFKGLRALAGISFTLKSSELLCIIGPNGAGKTVLLNVISGVYPPDSGEIIFNNKNIEKLDMPSRVKLGISRTFQIPRVFNSLTVIENLLIPAFTIRKMSYNEALREAEKILKFIRLDHLKYELSKNLSGGQKKLLEIGRALMTSPRLMLLDEPLAGVNPILVELIIEVLRELIERGISVIIVNHETLYLKKIKPDRVLAMSSGRIIAEGPLEDVISNKAVIESYLGR